jgi:hypothetical protein
LRRNSRQAIAQGLSAVVGGCDDGDFQSFYK